MLDQHTTPFLISLAATLSGAAILALTPKLRTKLKQLSHPLTNRLLTLLNNLDHPVMIRKSRLNSLMTASDEREELQTQLEFQKKQYQKLINRTQNHKSALQDKEARLGRITDLWEMAGSGLKLAATEKENLCEKISLLENDNNTLKNFLVGKIGGRTGDTCLVSGHYMTRHNEGGEMIRLDSGEIFPPCIHNRHAISALWTLNNPD